MIAIWAVDCYVLYVVRAIGAVGCYILHVVRAMRLLNVTFSTLCGLFGQLVVNFSAL